MTTKRALLRILERERESFAAERKLLIDQICHLARQPWTPAPSDFYGRAEEPEPEEPVLVHTDHWPE
jgi:hypothetical protein